MPAPDLQIIGAGFGRTGTLSLREALVRLGCGPCDHMLDNFERPERFALWVEALHRKHAGEPIDWRPLLADYRAIVDWPGTYFWRELTAAHPDAKVILTVRDPDRWYESILATIFSVVDENSPEVPRDIIWDRTFNGRFSDRAHCQTVFSRHNDAVREAIPPERLLVFDVKDGWAPLCTFLDVPVPEHESFPRINDTAEFNQRAQELQERMR
jgi:hypothetical protein